MIPAGLGGEGKLNWSSVIASDLGVISQLRDQEGGDEVCAVFEDWSTTDRIE
jgi:hypothetical protein